MCCFPSAGKLKVKSEKLKVKSFPTSHFLSPDFVISCIIKETGFLGKPGFLIHKHKSADRKLWKKFDMPSDSDG
ncbi:MAG: hypothetical protein DRI57_19755 [Deltaproteobacteria bacterium]|nr:MAG: hypothetical protein DRI57_19755 [Deltaproteobacteria bacterium]